MEQILDLIEEIDDLDYKHENYEFKYLNQIETDTNYCSWLLPPEYKLYTLGRNNVKWTYASDIYCMMIEFYQKVTGHLPGVNFQMNNIAIKDLITNLDTTDDIKRATINLFIRCTTSIQNKRIKSIDELKEDQSYKYIERIIQEQKNKGLLR